jgi:hypothetical protein
LAADDNGHPVPHRKRSYSRSAARPRFRQRRPPYIPRPIPAIELKFRR